MLDFCLVLQETSELTHGLGSMCGGNNSCNPSNNNSIPATSTEHGLYTCVYCCATFPQQNKLTRHILHTHSLDSLKYREHHSLLGLLPPELSISTHFPHRQLEALDPNDHPTSPMDIDFAVATVARFQNAVAAAAASSSAAGGNSTLTISANSNIGGGGVVGVVGQSPSSSVTSAAAAMAACSSSSSDPNSVVLCKFCGKSFPDVASLITHLPVHTGDRPFKCEFCGKAFKLRHHMKDHCRVHTGKFSKTKKKYINQK